MLKVWRSRKEESPHRPKRAKTGWMVVVLALVVMAIWMLGQIA